MRILKLASFFLAALTMSCRAAQPSATSATPAPATTTVSPSPTNKPSPTPTLMGTWSVIIDGLVYDASAGPEHPIAGAIVRYDRFSYLSLPPCGQTVTDSGGRYELTLLVHDTDSITISAKAPGFVTYSEKHDGVWFFAGARQVNIGLAPLVTPTLQSISTHSLQSPM